MPDAGHGWRGDAPQVPVKDPAAPVTGMSDRPRTHGSPHGKRSSWLLIATVIVAFAAGGAALATHAWWLFWACLAVVVLAIPAGKAIGVMEDTVSWETPAALSHATSPPPEHTADPAGRGCGSPPPR
jgi:hypothetical protein